MDSLAAPRAGTGLSVQTPHGVETGTRSSNSRKRRSKRDKVNASRMRRAEFCPIRLSISGSRMRLSSLAA